MAKSKKEFNLSGLQNLSLDKQPDIEKAVEEVKPKSSIEAIKAPTVPKKTTKVSTPKKKEEVVMKSTSFKIEADLHRAIKEYSFFEEVEMVEYIFEQLVKNDLKEKGYYPPRKRKRR